MTGQASDRAPALVACAHGTADPAGQAAIGAVREAIARHLPGVEVLRASVDVEDPSLDDVVAGLVERGREAVVVPLLLSAGYHVFHDVALAAAGSGGLVRAAAALGPDGALIDLLARRLESAGVTAAGATVADGGRRPPVVLAAAGSSDARAVDDVHDMAARLAARLGAPVRTAFLSAAQPRVEDVVRPGDAVATYLLAPGFFHDLLRRRAGAAGAVAVTGPLAPDDTVAELAARRYRAALRAPVTGAAP